MLLIGVQKPDLRSGCTSASRVSPGLAGRQREEPVRGTNKSIWVYEGAPQVVSTFNRSKLSGSHDVAKEPRKPPYISVSGFNSYFGASDNGQLYI